MEKHFYYPARSACTPHRVLHGTRRGHVHFVCWMPALLGIEGTPPCPANWRPSLPPSPPLPRNKTSRDIFVALAGCCIWWWLAHGQLRDHRRLARAVAPAPAVRQDERPLHVGVVQEVRGPEASGGDGRPGVRRRRRRGGGPLPGPVLRGRGGREGGPARAGVAAPAAAVGARGEQDRARRPRRQGPPRPHGRRRRPGAPPRQGREDQAGGARPRQRRQPQAPRLRSGLLRRPHPHLRRHRPRQEAQGPHGRLPGRYLYGTCTWLARSSIYLDL